MQDDRLSALRTELERPPFNAWLAPEPVAVDDAARAVEIRLPVRAEFSYHPERKIVHGGVLAALADIAGYATVALFHGGATPTMTLQIDYLSASEADVLTARGMLRKLGRTASRADVEISGGGRLLAIARGTFSTAGGRA